MKLFALDFDNNVWITAASRERTEATVIFQVTWWTCLCLQVTFCSSLEALLFLIFLQVMIPITSSDFLNTCQGHSFWKCISIRNNYHLPFELLSNLTAIFFFFCASNWISSRLRLTWLLQNKEKTYHPVLWQFFCPVHWKIVLLHKYKNWPLCTNPWEITASSALRKEYLSVELIPQRLSFCLNNRRTVYAPFCPQKKAFNYSIRK